MNLHIAPVSHRPQRGLRSAGWSILQVASASVAGMGAGAGLAFLAALASALALLAFAPAARAGEPLANAVFSVGTTTTNAQGAAWSYLLWQPTDPAALAGRTLAVYAKPGAAEGPGAYERRTVTRRQIEPAIIQSLIQRAAQLGDDAGLLETRVDALFAAALPKSSLSLAEKVSAVVRGAQNDPRLLGNLVFLGRLHPALNLCLGHAWAEPVGPGLTTYEIRDFDPVAGVDRGVIGRVTVDPAAPVVLPAPGRPVQFPEASAKGDLNIKLRWATPDPLREVGLLQHGFNVYRMTRGFAEQRGFHQNPPARDQLPALLASGGLRRIHETPVTVSRLHDAGSVGNFQADPTWYIADDNGRYRPGGQGFVNGEEFYYVVTARDLLGRDGEVSAAGLAMACDRVPPAAPDGVVVENHYTYANGQSNQALRVTWRQAPNTGDVVTAYYVYRWTNATDAVRHGVTDPAIHRIAGPIPHQAGQATASWIDVGPGSPRAPEDYDKTWWYTVRAADQSACTNNLSPNSVPVFGVLRDRTAPGGTSGDLGITCCQPGARADKDFVVTDPAATDTNLAYFRFVATRTNLGPAYAEFYVSRGNLETNLVGRRPFPAGLAPAVLDWSVSRATMGSGFHRTFVRVIGPDDRASGLVETSVSQLPGPGSRHVVNASAFVTCQRVRVRPPSPLGGGEPDCSHAPVSPDDGETIEPPMVFFLPAAGSREFRLYRRINAGPMTLIKQGPITNDPPVEIAVADPHPPANAGTLCYFVQTLDEQGNAGPVSPIGDCLKFKLPNPRPMLSPLESVGTEGAPQMAIRWFCPPFGVERFEVCIAVGGGALPDDVGGGLTRVSAVPELRWVRPPGAPAEVQREFHVFHTPRVGPQFGDGGSFEVLANISAQCNHLVFVKPIGLDGSPDPQSRASQAEQLLWSVPVVKGPKVPWPARPLPAVGTNAFPAWVRPVFINSTNLTTNFVGVGVIVGTTGPGRERPAPGQAAVVDGPMNPLELVAKSAAGDSLFPLVVYRYQETNQYFPTVSGDLTQVTPMMEAIAYNTGQDAAFGLSALIYDPFVDVYQASQLGVPELGGGGAGRNALVLLDTQPVVIGARYRYLLVRFGADREIVEVIPTAAVDIL